MANNSNAYAGAKPLTGSVVDDLQQQEENNFRRRQEKRIEDQLAEQRKEKEEAKKEKLRQQMLGQIPKNFDTGSSSLNEFNGKLIQQGVNRLGEIYTQLGKPGVSDDERIKLQIEAQNIENLPSNIELATDNFSKVIQDYQQGKAEGRYFENPDFERLVLGGFDNYVGTLDNGLPTVGFIDRNGDGTVDVKDVQPFENLANGIPTFNFQKQYDTDKMAVETAKALGKTDVTKDSNFLSRQTIGPNVEALDTVTNNLFTKPDGSPTDVALSEVRKMGLQPDEEGLAKAKAKFKERVLANTDTTYKEQRDYGAMNQSARLRYDMSKDDDDKIYQITDLAYNVDTKQGGETTGNSYHGDVNIVRKVGQAQEQFRSFTRNKDGSISVKVDVSTPKYSEEAIQNILAEIPDPAERSTREAELRQERSIDTKTYSSKGQAGDVMFYANRFIDPKTNEPIRNFKQLDKRLKDRGSSIEKKKPTAEELYNKYRPKR